jgi:hypothetical protein
VISTCRFIIALKRNPDRCFHDRSQYIYAPEGFTPGGEQNQERLLGTPGKSQFVLFLFQIPDASFEPTDFSLHANPGE